MRLRWYPPSREHRKGDIVRYEIMYSERSKPTNVYDANSSDTEYVLDGLEPESVYVFQVKAYTSKGAGPWSNKTPYRTYGQCKWFFISDCFYINTGRSVVLIWAFNWIYTHPFVFIGYLKYSVFFTLRSFLQTW